MADTTALVEADGPADKPQFLFYDWGCMVWQSLALQYGKRPAYLFSLLTNIVILATAPLCINPHTYQASRILLGLFGSLVESLCEVSITDIVTSPCSTPTVS